MNSEKGSNPEPTRTSYTPSELKKFDEKLKQERPILQDKLDENIKSHPDKKIIGVGVKKENEPFYRLKPSRPNWMPPKKNAS